MESGCNAAPTIHRLGIQEAVLLGGPNVRTALGSAARFHVGSVDAVPARLVPLHGSVSVPSLTTIHCPMIPQRNLAGCRTGVTGV